MINLPERVKTHEFLQGGSIRTAVKNIEAGMSMFATDMNRATHYNTIEDLEKASVYREGLFSSMVDGLCVLDLNGNVIEVNVSLLEMLRMKKSQILGLHVTQVLSSIVEPDDLPTDG